MNPSVAVRAEIAKQQYSTLSNHEIADALNAPIQSYRSVDTKQIVKFLILNGSYGVLIVESRGVGSMAILCSTIIAVLDSSIFQDIDFEDPNVRTLITSMCDALISTGVFSASDKESILSLGMTTTSIAKSLGWSGNITLYDVATLRS